MHAVEQVVRRRHAVLVSLLNGMTLLAVGPENKFIVRGGVLLLAVWMDQRMAK